MDPAHRSIHPNIPGVPWYAAVLIAVTATAIGYGIDAGHKELTHVFAGFYIAGCVAAVLAVRQDGVFTTIIQPPLILFGAVPGAYWLFHDAKIGHLKDLLINCGYPLIERFPLMLGTAGGVLAIGLARWYYGTFQRPAAASTADNTAGAAADVKSFFSSIGAKLQSMVSPDRDAEDGDDAADARRSRPARSSSTTRRTTRSTRSTTRSARSRHTRPLDDAGEPIERPRRSTRRSPASARDYDAAVGRDYDSAEPPRRSRRRPRPDADPEQRGQAPREARREPRSRRSPYERPSSRSSRFDGYDRYDPPSAPELSGRYEGRYEAPEPYEPRRRRPPSNGTNGTTGTHHPISQVRYRGAADSDQPRDERRARSRYGESPGRPPAESWEYGG